ncbi:type IV pilin protein [Dokdonella sp.]|uniref:type IV pilin protein n=1 Tax=Dokdonella sp. TaxID=2291710 RepID=UPI0025C21619|nr:type IV pilin protein [Dokdonella sp.]MBX3692093.1 type IV pilin protein [Dokdonella sp.]MCW5566947.1 type IV pilin protein [Dokdonella sp.]
MNRNRGFTLLELMIVVAIIAVLAALAYPSYTRYVERTRRADGRELLMRISAAQERFFTNRNRYAATFTDLSVSDTSEKGYYRVTIGGLGTNNQTYTLTATPQAPQNNDSCGALTINNTGFKAAPSDTGSNGACW